MQFHFKVALEYAVKKWEIEISALLDSRENGLNLPDRPIYPLKLGGLGLKRSRPI